MGLGVIVDDGSGLEKYVEVDDLALCFFDSFIAAVSPLHEFSWFECKFFKFLMVTQF